MIFSPESLRFLVSTYGEFNDAVLKSVLCHYYPDKPGCCVKATIECMNIARSYEWEMVTLSFEDVHEFRFLEGRTSNVVLTNVQIEEMEDKFLVNFSPYVVPF